MCIRDRLYSDYFSHIDNWMMQEELPMLYNQYKITIPHVFVYNIELRGKDYLSLIHILRDHYGATNIVPLKEEPVFLPSSAGLQE